jgi:hypothetical protein
MLPTAATGATAPIYIDGTDNHTLMKRVTQPQRVLTRYSGLGHTEVLMALGSKKVGDATAVVPLVCQWLLCY